MRPTNLNLMLHTKRLFNHSTVTIRIINRATLPSILPIHKSINETQATDMATFKRRLRAFKHSS
jgi:hypothetical protein